MIRRLLGFGNGLMDTVGVLLGLTALWIYPHLPGSDSPVATLLFLAGVVLVLGAFAGHVAQQVNLPRITGCILVGVLINPTLPDVWPLLAGLRLVDAQQMQGLTLINDLAIGLIALMAGAEVRLSWLRARLAAILAITGVSSLLVPGLLMGALLVLPYIPGIGAIPFMDQAVAAGIPSWAVAGLAGVIFLANSPTVVVSVIKESRADGPMSQTVMGVSVVVDVLVILLFTLLMALITVMSDGQGSVATAVGQTAGSIVMSVAVGVLVGIGLAHYTEQSDHRLSWTLVGLALAVATLGPLIHLKPLFCLLAAGFACENLTRRRTTLGSHRLEAGLARVANPVFVMFFVVAGMGLNLSALMGTWVIVLALSFVRFVAVWWSTRLGAHLGGADPAVPQYGWIGLLSQAGVTLALVPIVAQRFPGWGDELATIIVAMVAVHQIIGPAAFAWAIRRAGEAAPVEAAPVRANTLGGH
ncbi:MAG: cation:proton antiporter [Planctomycetes bacterium]|nr:cation:proton antiporter [Planctomycetota bacterium]